MGSGLINDTRSRKERNCRTYLVGGLAALGRATRALVATTCGDGVRLCDDGGREGQNWQEKSRCLNEHGIYQEEVSPSNAGLCTCLLHLRPEHGEFGGMDRMCVESLIQRCLVNK